MKGFQQIEEHPTHYVFHHDDGHQVHVAKAGLSKRTLQHIQNFAEGGKAQPQQPPAPISQDTAQQFAQGFNSATMAPKPKKMYDGGTAKAPTEMDPDQQQPALEQQAPAAEVAPQEEAPTRDLAGSGEYGFQKMIAVGKEIPGIAKNVAEGAKNAWNNFAPNTKYYLSGGQPQAQPQQKDVALAAGESNPNVVPAMERQVNLGATQGKKQSAPAPLTDYSKAYQRESDQYIKGLQAEANAEGKLGTDQADVHEKEVAAIEAYHTAAKTNFDNLYGQMEDLKKNIADTQIDPHRYFSKMDTGQKISTALGLILGGMGGALTHQENPVMKFINSQIDTDLNAQKAEMGKKENLLGAMYKQYGNMQDAETAYRVYMKTITEGKIAKLAAAAKDPITQARNQQLASKFEMDKTPEMAKLADRQAGLQLAASVAKGNGQLPPGVAGRLIETLVPEHLREKAYEQWGQSLEAYQKGDDIMREFDRVNQEHTLFRSATHASFITGNEPAAVGNLENMFLPLVRDREGKPNEYEFKTMKKFIPLPGDTAYKVAEKRRGLETFLEQKKAAPLLREHGIPTGQAKKGRVPQVGPGFQQIGFKR